MTHKFISKIKKYPALATKLLETPDVKTFLKNLDEISKSEDDNESANIAFGAGVDMLAEYYLTSFGNDCNIEFNKSIEANHLSEKPNSISYYGVSSKKHSVGNKECLVKRIAEAGSTVYIRTEATLNSTTEHKTNDDPGILNFFAIAQSHATKTGQAYQARYVLVTTGKGLHYTLDRDTDQMIEVIDRKTLSKRLDNNIPFWNRIRNDFGLLPLSMTPNSDIQHTMITDELKEFS